jgi:hypothetical protein
MQAQEFTEFDADLLPTGQAVAFGPFEYLPYVTLRDKIEELKNLKGIMCTQQPLCESQ